MNPSNISTGNGDMNGICQPQLNDAISLINEEENDRLNTEVVPNDTDQLINDADLNKNTMAVKPFLSTQSPSKVSFDLDASQCNKDLDDDPEDDEAKTSRFNNCGSFKKSTWGWIVVCATWAVMIPFAGTLASFGTLIDPLTEEFNATKLETGWLGSLSFSFTVGTCPLSTPLFNVFGGRKLAFVGAIGGSISLVITSFAPSIFVMFISYSIMFGIFTNFVYNSGMSLTGQYFADKNQALSTCLASAGISFGTLLVNPLSEVLVSNVGWRNTLRVMASLVLIIGLFCASLFKPLKTAEQQLHTKLKRIQNKTGRNKILDEAYESNKNLDKQAVTESLQNCTESKISLAAKEMKNNITDKRMWDCDICRYPTTVLWMLGTLFWSLSFLFPMIFLISYMKTVDIEPSDGAWVLTAYGISEFGGRILCAIVASKLTFSYAYVYAFSSALSGFATIFAPKVGTLTVMYVYSVAIGVNSGILNSMMFASTMQFFGNSRGPHVWGYINVMLALGMMIGPVTAGGIYDMTKSYITSFYIGGGMFMLCTFTMLLIPQSLKHFPIKSLEAKGKRDKKNPSDEKSSSNNRIGSIVKVRKSSLRKLTMLNQLQDSKDKYGKGVRSELGELDEIHSSEESSQHTNSADCV